MYNIMAPILKLLFGMTFGLYLGAVLTAFAFKPVASLDMVATNGLIVYWKHARSMWRVKRWLLIGYLKMYRLYMRMNC